MHLTGKNKELKPFHGGQYCLNNIIFRMFVASNRQCQTVINLTAQPKAFPNALYGMFHLLSPTHT